ncbi:uncharacterized protein LOC107479717 isoform X2 [Arachis duranensis]|uniref:Uncharacterized protein LOC107479717 isoform X2 n=1 Tax=Arachis duranensis TaxID=130453 RepID=A0A9C6WRW4_ARADU|nr:uncharacterized protein LOC107479717 isoform X2 [Arachis duranensis]XP_052115684.1 uncharacterized protein LOC107479717 isoform X2 [Arachis duranensis]
MVESIPDLISCSEGPTLDVLEKCQEVEARARELDKQVKLLVRFLILHTRQIHTSQCLVDLCGALHCDIEINFGLKKSKCNPAAAARNKHLCERDEKGNSTVEAHLSNWQKEKTILMDRFVIFGSSRFSNTFRIHRSLLICDSGYCTPNSAIGKCSWRRRARKTAKSAPRFLHVCCKPISLQRLSKHKFELQD